MRKDLAPHFNKRTRFCGTFIKYGQKNGYKGRLEQTVLLINIIEITNPTIILTDHLWFNYTKGFSVLNLQSGDIIEFNARVDVYQKGYSEDSEDNPFRLDYRLTYPRNIKIVGKAEDDFSENDRYNKSIIEKIIQHNDNRLERLQHKRDKNEPLQQSLISTPKRKIGRGRDTTLFDFLKKKAE
jgi:hypothetical protein